MTDKLKIFNYSIQLAKLAGNKVVATCGGEKKSALLKSLGADRVIDYKKEDIKSVSVYLFTSILFFFVFYLTSPHHDTLPLFQVLKKEFPAGINVIYESVGGDMFNWCLSALATYGRLIVIGMVSQVILLILF